MEVYPEQFEMLEEYPEVVGFSLRTNAGHEVVAESRTNMDIIERAQTGRKSLAPATSPAKLSGTVKCCRIGD